MRNTVFFILSLLISFTSCCNEEHNETNDKIIGAWYNEEYQEYDKYMPSGLFYYEFPSSIDGNFVKGTGEYTLNDNELIMNTVLLGQNIQSSNIIEKLTEYELVYRDKSDVNLTFKYLKVVNEEDLNIADTTSLELGFETSINGYANISTGTAILDVDNQKIYGMNDGTAYIKVQSEKGDVFVRINVHNDKNVPFPDFTILLGRSAEQVVQMIGTPFEQNSSFIYYSFKNNDYVKNAMCVFDEEMSTNIIGVTLSEKYTSEEIKDYLNTKYTYADSKPDEGKFAYMDSVNRIAIIYNTTTAMLTIYYI